MQVMWEVADGYAGKSIPQYTMINDSEFEGVETEEERMQIIEQIVEEDFRSRIFPEIIRIGEKNW